MNIKIDIREKDIIQLITPLQNDPVLKIPIYYNEGTINECLHSGSRSRIYI